MKTYARYFRAAFAALLLLQSLSAAFEVAAAPASQENDPFSSAEELLESMTPQERVGQLFLVTFEGSQVPEESQIYDLISNYHIGGVVLKREMDNFVAQPETLEGARDLISSLQRVEANSSQEEVVDPVTGAGYLPNYVPLFIAISQEGDGYPNDELLGVLSPQPNAMTLGATWDVDLAERSGELLGSELDALGINMLLGPSLDVLENPNPQSAGDLGVRSFGGDPYWVGQMGQAYIEGVHVGSDGRVAVVAEHLPGYGAANRPPEEEIPTIRKSLSQLTQIELVPFFAVSGEASREAAQADAMLMAHIRYQGFQGNIRATTRPVSFDPQAFSELMALPALADWRDEGGVIISDQLGTRAVRRNYDVTEQVFNAHLVARDAFLAGNDMLYLGNFMASGDTDSYTTIVRTAEFFTQKYREDQAFAERVDASVLRILALKFKLYPTFLLSRVLPNEAQIAQVGQESDLIFEIGRSAATLLSPDAPQLPELLPVVPTLNEQVVFITDSYQVQQCSDCTPTDVVQTDALRQSVLRLYGPGTGNQVAPGNLTSYSFAQLETALNLGPTESNLFFDNIQRAEWLVFSMLKEDSERSSSLAMARLLAERPDLLQGKQVIVFAMNAPYFLDATDITKITAYYALYSKNSQMADVAARLLFQEVSPLGASPVSVEGVGYNLIQATSPDPDSEIPITVTRIAISNEAEQETETAEIEQPNEATTTEPATFQVGDILTIQAGPIRDYNGHRVPDNTPVTFYISITSEGSPVQRQITANIQNGLAQTSYSIESEGNLQIWAESGSPAAASQVMLYDVVGINVEGVALQATQTALAEIQATATDSNGEAAAVVLEELHDQTTFADWFTVLLITTFVSVFAYQTGTMTSSVRWGARWALAALVGGLMFGSYLSLGLPGTATLLTNYGEGGAVLMAVLGSGLGWLAGWYWKERLEEERT